jgi:hypothetical protein
VPERERAQEGAQRRGRQRAVAEQRLAAAGAQHVAVVDRIGTAHHRLQKRADLAARPGGPRTLTKPDDPIDQPLDAEPVDQRAGQHHPALATSRSTSNSTATESARTKAREPFTIRVTS